MTKQLRCMLLGIAFLVLGAWGAALYEVMLLGAVTAMIAPIAGIISIVISFYEHE